MVSGVSIKVRPATEADHPFILSLLPRFAENLPPWRTPAQIVSRTEHELLESFGKDEDLVIIAEDEQRQPLGFVRLAIRPDFFSVGFRGYVAELAVTPAGEGRGVAQVLMAVAQDWAHTLKLEVLSLHVFATNGRARRFYEKLGFQPEVVEYVKLLEIPADD